MLKAVWGFFLLCMVLAAPSPALAVEDTPPAGGEMDEMGRMQYGLGRNATWLLPDLQTLAPTDLRLVAGSQRRLIRFTNSIWNSGAGPIELRGSNARNREIISVAQIVYRLNGHSAGTPMDSMVYSSLHDHWHWQGFARYQVWSLRPDGSLDQVVASSDKVGFCLRDDETIQDEAPQPDLPESGFGPRRPSYGSCHWSQQGISVGWVDIYRDHLPDQIVEIGDLQPGRYALVSTANPERKLLEANLDNNTAQVFFELGENTIQVLESPFQRQGDSQSAVCDCVK